MPLEVICFICKMAGAVCILAGCTGMSYLQCTGLTRRLSALREFYQLLMKISADIRCMGEPLPQVMENVGKSAGPVYQPFFEAVARDMLNGENQTFSQIWGRNLDKYLSASALKATDLSLIRELGNMLGSHDRKMQISVLELFCSRLDGEIHKSAEAMDNQKRVYGGLWVLGGIFLVVLFI